MFDNVQCHKEEYNLIFCIQDENLDALLGELAYCFKFLLCKIYPFYLFYKFKVEKSKSKVGTTKE